MLCPAGFFGEVDDIAMSAVFMASQAGRWITSETLVVDGGQWYVTCLYSNVVYICLKQARCRPYDVRDEEDDSSQIEQREGDTSTTLQIVITHCCNYNYLLSSYNQTTNHYYD